MSIAHDLVVEHAHRLVVLHPAVQVAAIISVHGIAVHLDEAPVRLVLRLTLQVDGALGVLHFRSKDSPGASNSAPGVVVIVVGAVLLAYL